LFVGAGARFAIGLAFSSENGYRAGRRRPRIRRSSGNSALIGHALRIWRCGRAQIR
jgi:hypothetical protein